MWRIVYRLFEVASTLLSILLSRSDHIRSLAAYRRSDGRGRDNRSAGTGSWGYQVGDEGGRGWGLVSCEYTRFGDKK